MDKKKNRRLTTRILRTILFIILVLSLGVYSGFRNAEDDIFKNLKLSEINENTQVFRDHLGTPTIIAQDLNDLIFVQGYEFARDRSFQLQIFYSIVNGKLSEIFGNDLIEADILLKTLDFKSIGERAEARLDNFYIDLVQSYVNGINLYYERHEFNLPWEFQVLGLEPNPWSVSDSLAIQALLSYNFDFNNFKDEIVRLQVVQQIGINKSLEILPIHNSETQLYLQSNNSTLSSLESTFFDPLANIFSKSDFQGFSANSWVLAGSQSETGNPIIANDPQVGLEIPSFWYQINLQMTDNSLNVQGYTIPGLPLVFVGHNMDIGWGISPSNVDTLDLLYLTHNETHYFYDNSWIEFAVKELNIKVAGFPTTKRNMYSTEMGPILNITDEWYVIKWTMLEDVSRDQMIRALYQINIARDINEMYNALEYFVAPNLNFIFADTLDGIGAQTAGLIPIRDEGYGYIPKNGSEINQAWTDFVEYDNMSRIQNPERGFIISTGQPLKDNNFYQTSHNLLSSYRNERITNLLNDSMELKGKSDEKFGTIDMKKIQGDVLNLAGESILSPLFSDIQTEIDSHSDLELQPLLDELTIWDYEMNKESVAATIFATFRIFFVEEILSDELEATTVNLILNDVIGSVSKLLINNKTDLWFDDISTVNITEAASQIAYNALKSTQDFLNDEIGDKIENWNWGRMHSVSFNHIMGNSAPLLGGLNLGPNSMNGSTFTVNSFHDSPKIVNDKINFRSTFGPSFRLIMEVNGNWTNVEGMHAPGMSGHLTSEHYDDGHKNWVNLKYDSWLYNPLVVLLVQELTITFSHGESNE